MKTILFVMNCFGGEIKEYLRQSQEFAREYSILDQSTYLKSPDESYEKNLRSADIVISQGVKATMEFGREFIEKNMKHGALHVQLAFWRFDGFWPIENPLKHKCSFFWFPCLEFGPGLSFSDYINHSIKESIVINKFEQELDKLSTIDASSDIKIFDKFLNNYKIRRTFGDHWHPMSFLFREISSELLKIIGINFDPVEFPPVGINSDRYRLINKAVLDTLGMELGRLWSTRV